MIVPVKLMALKNMWSDSLMSRIAPRDECTMESRLYNDDQHVSSIGTPMAGFILISQVSTVVDGFLH
jgi:hypothetical protein